MTVPGPDSPISMGPNHTSTAKKLFNSPNVKIVALVLLAIGIPYNIYLSRSLSHEKALRSHEFGYSAVSSLSSVPNEELAGYIAAPIEDYIVNNSKDLGYENLEAKEARGCDIWKDPGFSNEETFNFLNLYKRNLKRYEDAIKHYKKPSSDFNLMKTMKENHGLRDWDQVCKSLRPVPDGLQSLFSSNQLSFLQKQGFLEPLLTPLRHPDFCDKNQNLRALVSLEYLVHDFEAMCLKLKPHSKLILIDAGASLKFHGRLTTPIAQLINTYNKFGFYFDHIYAFEVDHTDPAEVYNDLLPQEYIPSYHWINTGKLRYLDGIHSFYTVIGNLRSLLLLNMTTTGISADEGHKMNPLETIVSEFSEDDFIVFKLDIDTSIIEVPLAQQLLASDRLTRLIDQFYFEHHVNIAEMEKWWGNSMSGTIKESLDLMQGLRKKGVASHYWI